MEKKFYGFQPQIDEGWDVKKLSRSGSQVYDRERYNLKDLEDVLRAIEDECDDLRELLKTKNTKYGNSIFNPVNVFSKLPPEDQIAVRLDDKISRIVRGLEEDEDPDLDMIGYLILKRIWNKHG
jgi:hypothetical protein